MKYLTLLGIIFHGIICRHLITVMYYFTHYYDSLVSINIDFFYWNFHYYELLSLNTFNDRGRRYVDGERFELPNKLDYIQNKLE